MSGQTNYDSNLAMGLGLIEETKILLRIWSPPLDATGLYERVLVSGLLPNVTAYRLRNIVVRCFSPRYLRDEAKPARNLKALLPALASAEIIQLFFLYTCRANAILADFIRNVYWPKYEAGRPDISRVDAEDFIRRAIDDGKTPSQWAEGQIKRVGRYLTGCCSDFGLLGKRTSTGRQLIPFRIEPKVAAYLAHELHFSGLGDNTLTLHPDWQLFGMTKADVLEELKRHSLKGLLILQSAGDITTIGWKSKKMEELLDVLAQS